MFGKKKKVESDGIFNLTDEPFLKEQVKQQRGVLDKYSNWFSQLESKIRQQDITVAELKVVMEELILQSTEMADFMNAQMVASEPKPQKSLGQKTLFQVWLEKRRGAKHVKKGNVSKRDWSKKTEVFCQENPKDSHNEEREHSIENRYFPEEED